MQRLHVTTCRPALAALTCLALLTTSCAGSAASPTPGDASPPPRLEGLARERREVRFSSAGATLAGELDLPVGEEPAPLVVVIHHSGPVGRDAYGYLAEILLAEGYAVFRFDKRGTGASGGTYGCCESADALAAYQSAVAQAGINRRQVFIVAQSIGTTHLAEQFPAYAATQQPAGVALLSNLLRADTITRIAAPVHIIVAASEPDVAAIGPDAAAAHQSALTFGASFYIAEGAEHTLFDISAGPIDWSDPAWVERYHRGAMASLMEWLASLRTIADHKTAQTVLDYQRNDIRTALQHNVGAPHAQARCA